MTVDAAWTKPGPGTWELDQSHVGAAPGPIQRGLYETCLPRGTGEGFALFGAPLKTMEMRWVNGRFYRRLVPLVGGSHDLPAPPRAAVWLLSRVHPAFRRAEARAKESLATKRWRAEIARWEQEWKPKLITRNLAYTDLDVATFDDAELADHLGELYAYVLETTALHFRLHVSDLGPLGLLMMNLEDWGLRRDDAFRALIDASPATREPRELLRAIADALRGGGVDAATITTLDEVRAVPVAAKALDDYLRLHGHRMTTGYDIEDRYLLELPGTIVASITGAAMHAGSDRDELAQQSIAALRDEVAPEHHAELDDIIEDARLSYGLRDENGPLTYEWPAACCGERSSRADAGSVSVIVCSSWMSQRSPRCWAAMPDRGTPRSIGAPRNARRGAR